MRISDWSSDVCSSDLVFPLPERSAVDRLTLRIGERVVEGRIMEKAEAERAYRAAADNGQRAGLVSGERPNVFVTSVANIGTGEDIAGEIGRAPCRKRECQ